MRKTITCGLLLLASFLVGTASGQSLNQQLVNAAFSGDSTKVAALIAEGADVNAKDAEGRTPLNLAARRTTTDVAKLLIAKGADVNAKDNHGQTPLFQASGSDMVDLLIAKGADVNARDNDGFPPIHYVRAEYMAILLIKKGADIRDIHVENKSEEDCVTIAAFPVNGDAKEMEVYLAYYDVDINCGKGELLYSAIQNGHANIVKVLLSHGANLNSARFDFLKEATELQNNAPDGRAIINILQDAIARQQHRRGSNNSIQALLGEFKGHSDIEVIRESIIDLALKSNPAPVVPPEAEAAAGRGAYIFKNASSMDDTLSAAKEYLTAIELAPWVANYYYNLCTVLEKTPYTQQALHACKLYLVAAPNAPDGGDMQQRIAGLQYASDRDKAQMKQRTVYIKSRGIDDLYRFGGITGTVSGREIVMKLFVDWSATPPKYQVWVGCLQGSDAYGRPHDLVTTDSWIGFCEPEINMHLVIQPEGEGFVAVSDTSGGSLRATLDDLFKAKQQTMAHAVMFSTTENQGERFYVTYEQGGHDLKHAGYLMFESDCNGSVLKQDPRALPDDFVSGEMNKGGSFGKFYPEVLFGQPNTNICASQFASKTGYHFGEAE